MPTITTIIPIFAIIALGAFARRRGFIPESFLDPANRLVYYLAIPAMVFRAISRASLQTDFDLSISLINLACIFAVAVVVFTAACVMRVPKHSRGTLTQCTFHGNLGYVGFAVIFYYLGEQGLARGSILAGFMMVLQNLLGVVALQIFASAEADGSYLRRFVGRIIINPVILSAMLGIAYASLNLPLPEIADRTLKIIGGLALPMALLLIGASLSFSLVRKYLARAMLASLIKNILLPSLGCGLFIYFGYTAQDFLPALILLAAPPATMTYVFATEMKGDKELAVAAISVGTVGSAFTYIFWLQLFS